ncbi:MAG: iron ABC transporter permease, partial [Betaproteobacteria bacterium]|nr:iron ABC transporter permease [Betaproteobacteria bacterium]
MFRTAGVQARALPWVVALLVAVPLLSLVVTAMTGTAGGPSAGIDELGLSRYALVSGQLALGVVAGTVVIGTLTGWVCAHFVFPGSRVLSWLLVLPIAVPGYVVAYAYADLLQ